MRAVIQIVGCAVTAAPTGGTGCAAISSALTLAAGGSLVDALKAGAFAFAQMGVWDVVGGALQVAGVAIQQGASFAANVGAALIKGGVHGVVGGALSLAQGGEFLQGFAANAIGALGGALGTGTLGNVGGFDGLVARTAMAAIAGCGAASLSGGKCANGAVTAAFAHLFNAEATLHDGVRFRPAREANLACADSCNDYFPGKAPAYYHGTTSEERWFGLKMQGEIAGSIGAGRLVGPTIRFASLYIRFSSNGFQIGTRTTNVWGSVRSAGVGFRISDRGLSVGRFKLNGKWTWRPSYHRGATQSQRTKHRPWERGW